MTTTAVQRVWGPDSGDDNKHDLEPSLETVDAHSGCAVSYRKPHAPRHIAQYMPIAIWTATGQADMKSVATQPFPDYSAISPDQAGDIAPVLTTLERLTATKVTRTRAITNRTAATGPSP